MSKLSKPVIFFLVTIFANAFVANAVVHFTANGFVLDSATPLIYGPAGNPIVMSFSVQDNNGQVQTFYCKRPHLVSCRAINAASIGKKISITGILDTLPQVVGWRLSTQEISFVYMDGKP